MQTNCTLQRVTVNEHGFWDDYAEAQLLMIKGDRLIAQAISDGIRGLRRRVVRRLDVGHRRHLPPI
jgi:hypothetical protein